MQLVHGVGAGVLLLTDRFGGFDPVLAGLVTPVLDRLAGQLGSIPGLTDAERQAVAAGAADTLFEAARRKATRVLVLELNAARLAGRLTAADSRARWDEWVDRASRPGFWPALDEHYPGLLARLQTVLENRCAAALALARRFAADRAALPALLAGPAGAPPSGSPAGSPTEPPSGSPAGSPTEPPQLLAASFGSGDSHRGGHTVAILRTSTGRVVYKPRSVEVDAALAGLLARLLPDEPPATRIRVPAVLCRDGYGWAEFVEHRYCAGEAEIGAFYRGLGQWLALMRLVGGSDLHAENLIAAGPVPVVVDCETLFTPHPAGPPSGYGLAVDRAAHLVGGSVLRSGLLPGRGVALGWRGVDVSAAGALPGQQPDPLVPVLVDAGTDQARVGLERLPIPRVANHPTPDPVLRRYWDLVLDAFVELTAALRQADAAGALAAELAAFADCPIRLVLRDTEVYAELARMLWHPVSLHDPAPARARAADLLLAQAKNMPEAPADPAVVDAEIDDLLAGDVPFFTTTPRAGWDTVPDLVDDALRRWRAADPDLDRQVIRSALVSAYLNEGWDADAQRLAPRTPSRTGHADSDRSRRGLAADVVRALATAAVRAEDRTVTWIAPVLTPNGWLVQPLNPDCYGGLAGLAVLFAGYLGEQRAGRADPVDAVPGLLADTLRTLRAAEDQAAVDRRAVAQRPEPPGGYVGLGSRIWAWLLLHRLGAVGAGEAVRRARALAELVPAGVEADATYDVLSGMAGAIVPLLRLSERDGDARWPALAADIAARLGAAARRTGPPGPADRPALADRPGPADRPAGRTGSPGTGSGAGSGLASWPNAMFPDGLGGFAHGVTGIGWALSRLAGTGVAAAAGLAEAAFGYEETLYDPGLGGWRDLREPDGDWAAATWCHGAGGIGIAAADLLGRTGEPRWAGVLRRAAAGCWATGMSWNHTLCHGDTGNWEVLRAAIAAGLGPAGVDRDRLDSYVLASVAEFGPVAGLARDAFSPGLLPGIGGVAYQLLRMHPQCPLPSVLLPDPGPADG